MSALFKRDGLLSIQAQGSQHIRLISAETNSDGQFRGVVRFDPNQVYKDESPLNEVLGDGLLFLTLDPSKGQRYQGVVPVEAENLAGCLSAYFEQSEQIPTVLIIYSNSSQCGGLLLQMLPPENIKDEEERKAQWDTLLQLCNTLNPEEFFSCEHESLLFRLFHEQGCRVLEKRDLQFKCSCSKERSANAIAALGKEDAFALIEEQKLVEINCEFCGCLYEFAKEDIENLFANDKQ
jgi:molecular chaperone Hsp33